MAARATEKIGIMATSCGIHKLSFPLPVPPQCERTIRIKNLTHSHTHSDQHSSMELM